MQSAAANSDDTAQFAPATPMPDYFGPVFVKELRQGLRAKRFVMPFIVAQAMAIIAVGTELGIASITSALGGSEITKFLGGIVYLVLWINIGVVMPLSSIAALRPELGDGRNVELLLMSNLSRWEIVRGKWLVGVSLSGLMLISLLPYLLTRYFVGGVDLIDNLSHIILMLLVNGVLTAVAIGASGFGNLIGRYLILGIASLSCLLTGGGACYLLFDRIESAIGFSKIWYLFLFAIVGLLVSALYVAYGLQLGRSRLRLFENPLDPPASGLVIALMIFTPIVVGVTSAISGGYFGWVAVVGLLVLALVIDRGPGKDAAIRYAQP